MTDVLLQPQYPWLGTSSGMQRWAGGGKFAQSEKVVSIVYGEETVLSHEVCDANRFVTRRLVLLKLMTRSRRSEALDGIEAQSGRSRAGIGLWGLDPWRCGATGETPATETRLGWWGSCWLRLLNPEVEMLDWRLGVIAIRMLSRENIPL